MPTCRESLEALLEEYEATLAEATRQLHRVEGAIIAVKDMLARLDESPSDLPKAEVGEV